MSASRRIKTVPEDPKLSLPIPIDLYFDLLTTAEQNGRPLTEEILIRLADSLTEDERARLDTQKLMAMIYKKA